MNRNLGTLAALCAITAIAASCGSDSSASSSTAAPVTAAATSTQPTSTQPTPPESTAAAATSAGDVEIKEFTFGPGEIHVAVGDTVTWTNSDNQKHTATSSGAFDTGAIEAGSTGTATFDSAGTFAYICAFHPFMKGTVVVGA